MTKVGGLQDALDILSEEITGKPVQEGVCRTCGGLVHRESFTDKMSRQEYYISGMCQLCQDKIFCEIDWEDDGE